MCGIFTILNNEYSYTSEEINKSFMEGQNRGPEFSELKEIDNNLLFGFHRLAINGLNSNANQPMTIDGITLICNGEIYNYKQLFTYINIKIIYLCVCRESNTGNLLGRQVVYH